MKRHFYVIFSFLLFIILACKSTPENTYKDIEKIVSEYDVRVLKKISQNAPPRFVAVLSADFKDLDAYNEDLQKLLFKQISSSGRLGLVEEKKVRSLISDNKLFPLHNDNDLFALGELCKTDYLLKAYIDSSKIDYIKSEKSVSVELTLKIDIIISADHSVLKTLSSPSSIKSSKARDIDNSSAVLYKAAQTAIKDIIGQIKDTFPAFGFVLRTDGPAYTTDLGKNVMADIGYIIAFISQGKEDPENPDNYLYEFYSAGVISRIDDISSVVIMDQDDRPPGNAIAVLIN